MDVRPGTQDRKTKRPFVTTDDERIADACRNTRVGVIMTSDGCRNGTERCAEDFKIQDAGLRFELI